VSITKLSENMISLPGTYAWTGVHSFAAGVTFNGTFASTKTLSVIPDAGSAFLVNANNVGGLTQRDHNGNAVNVAFIDAEGFLILHDSQITGMLGLGTLSALPFNLMGMHHVAEHFDGSSESPIFTSTELTGNSSTISFDNASFASTISFDNASFASHMSVATSGVGIGDGMKFEALNLQSTTNRSQRLWFVFSSDSFDITVMSIYFNT